ncbi:hypothetical protein [Cohnella sp. GCM10012308]|uniref:hypothetical protein n=1 Tax=Cohnella sp. GCM10012308 TaxID=3317329 RepID=UPI00360F9831
MSMYLRHYWSLFADFADAFGAVVYRGIPVPLLINFYQYLTEDMRVRMARHDFQSHLRNGSLKSAEIQPAFERYISLFRVRAKLRKDEGGKVLINGTYHRFPPRVFLEHFDPQRTLLLSRGKPYLGIPVVTLSHYEQDTSAETGRIARQVAMILDDTGDHPVFGDARFRDKLLKETPRIVQTMDAAERMLESNPVSCILVGTTEDLTSRALALAGGKLGIPSVCMQHGVIMGEEAFLPVFATVQAVYGKYEADWYAARGVPRESVRIAGHPRYDDIFTKVRDRKQRSVSEEHARSQQTRILMVTQPATNRPLWIAAVRLLLARLGSARIRIRPHPWEIKKGLLSEYEALAAELQAVELVPAETDLYDELSDIDLVIVENSTVGLEAMLSGKPVLIFRNPEERKRYAYYNRMAPYITNKPEALSELAARVLGDPAAAAALMQRIRRFIRRAYPRKLAGEQLERLIAELTGEQSTRGHAFFPEGMLLQAGEHMPGVIRGGRLHPFASARAFQASGRRWDEVIRFDERFAERIPAGEPIGENDTPASAPEPAPAPAQAPAPTPAQAPAPAPAPGPALLIQGQQEPQGLWVRGTGPDVFALEDGRKRRVVPWTDAVSAAPVLEADDRWLSRIPTGLPIFMREGERHRP